MLSSTWRDPAAEPYADLVETDLVLRGLDLTPR
jgi:hypothetical protein